MTQKTDEVVAHPDIASKAHDTTDHQDKAIPRSTDDLPPTGHPSSVVEPLLTSDTPQAPQEPLEANQGMATQSGSSTEDTAMDDGSSASTIHAYLGEHAPSLGTGSVNGDSIMDDGDSALGDEVESYV